MRFFFFVFTFFFARIQQNINENMLSFISIMKHHSFFARRCVLKKSATTCREKISLFFPFRCWNFYPFFAATRIRKKLCCIKENKVKKKVTEKKKNSKKAKPKKKRTPPSANSLFINSLQFFLSWLCSTKIYQRKNKCTFREKVTQVKSSMDGNAW